MANPLGECDLAPGVRRYDNGSGGYSLWGSKEDLIATGFAQPEWFADGKEKNKYGQIIRTKRFDVNGRRVSVTTPPAGMCRVHVRYSEEEAAPMRAREKEEYERQQMRENMHEPQTAGEYRKDCTRVFVAGLLTAAAWAGFTAPNFPGKPGPFRFDDDAMDEIRALVGDLLSIVENGTIIKVRDPINVDKLVAAAEAQRNSGFQRFMSRLVPTAGGAGHV